MANHTVKITFNGKNFDANYLARGGNSKIYTFNDEGKEYVVKFFSCSRKDLKEKRHNRFINEINLLENQLNNLDGVIPCLYSYKSNYPNKSYYIMPKCKKFSIYYNKSIKEKIKNILDLAIKLRKIHEKGVAHRDIKPDNILIYENKYCFADFGIAIEHDNPNRLTNWDEKVGPSIILPPELRGGNTDNTRLMYYKSDVYLLSKVLWMYLSKNEYGFYGEYKRDDNTIYFNPTDNENICCFEPLHLLWEGATCNDIDKRIDIDYFIYLLQEQILIIENAIDINRLNKYIYDEKINIFIAHHDNDKIIYNEPNKIYSFLNYSLEEFSIEIENVNLKIKYTDSKMQLKFENYMFILRRIINNRLISISFYVDGLIYDLKEKISILIIRDNKDQIDGKIMFDPNEIAFEDNFYLTSDYKIKIMPNY